MPGLHFVFRGLTSVLQVVHTEPYYSRKDDVPERPREFAGNVFRISHKDNLQVRGPGRSPLLPDNKSRWVL